MDDVTGKAVETASNSLEQISMLNPVMALLLIILLVIIGLLTYAVMRLSKKLDAKNDKLYEDAKTDLQLVMAFGDKIDNNTRIVQSVEKSLIEFKVILSNIQNLLELSLKKG